MKFKQKFTCLRYADNEECQGLISTKGTVYVGVDVWRLCNRMDINSYPYIIYDNLKEALEEVKVLPLRKCKAYYMPERKDYGNLC